MSLKSILKDTWIKNDFDFHTSSICGEANNYMNSYKSQNLKENKSSNVTLKTSIEARRQKTLNSCSGNRKSYLENNKNENKRNSNKSNLSQNSKSCSFSSQAKLNINK